MGKRKRLVAEARKEANKSIFVGNLYFEASEQDVRRHFNKLLKNATHGENSVDKVS